MRSSKEITAALSLNSPGTTITFIVTPTIPGMLIFTRKDQEYGLEQPVRPDEPQNRLKSLARSLKASPLHRYP
jgi:hypothetical protein